MVVQPSPGLTLRKLADKSEGERVIMANPDGSRKLVNPDTPGEEHEPWPFVGIRILDDPIPDPCRLSTNLVEQGISEGWITVDGEEMVHRPGGPPENKWRLTHSLRHFNALVVHTVDGDVHYEVTRQPDKYYGIASEGDKRTTIYDVDDDAEVTDEIYATGETVVDRFYELKLVK